MLGCLARRTLGAFHMDGLSRIRPWTRQSSLVSSQDSDLLAV